MKKHCQNIILILFSFFIFNLSTKSQTVEVVDFYVNNDIKSTIYRRFDVLVENHDILHGYYREISETDILLVDGKYSKGEKVGEWTYYFDDKEGVPKKIEIYKGSKINIDERYSNGLTKVTGTYATLNKKRVKTGNWIEWQRNGKMIKEENYNDIGKFHGEVVLYDENQFVVRTENYVNGKLTGIKDTYFHQKERIKKQLEFCNKFELLFPAIYKNEVKDFRKYFKNYTSLPNNSDKFSLGRDIELELLNINDKFIYFKTEEKEIDELYQSVKKYERDFNPIFKAQIKPYEKTITEYNKIGEIQKKINLGKNIIDNLSYFEDNFTKIKNKSENVHQEFKNAERKYKSFDKINTGDITKMRSDILIFDQAKDLRGKLEISKQLLENLKFINEQYNTLVKVDNSIGEKLDPMLQKYKSNYIIIYKNELQEFNKKITNYRNSGFVKPKVELGIEIMDKLNYYEKVYGELKELDAILNEKKEGIKIKYENEFPSIFIGVKKNFYVDISNWEKSGQADLRIREGNDLVKRAKELIDSYDLIFSIKLQIVEKVPQMTELYKLNFPKIFNGEVKQISADVAAWYQKADLPTKINTGNRVIIKLDEMINIHPRLIEQKDSIEEGYEKVYELYKKTFPNIFVTEIKTITITDYQDLDNTKGKKLKGDRIITQIKDLNKKYDYLLLLLENIEQEFPLLEQNYKKEFPNIYKNDINSISNSIKAWKKISSSETKRTNGDRILKKMKLINDMITNFTDQKTKINNLYTDFVEKYKTDKTNKVIYKKGNKAYNEIYKYYNDEGNVKSKKKKGNRVIKLLENFLDTYQKDNTKLISKLKNCKTDSEIERAFQTQ